MKCHYEVLNVSRDADLDEIKSSYRKLALKWHPDKNLNNADYAKEQFQIIQQSYDVLSDKNERAWYDKHREQILYGSNSGIEENVLDLYQYFSTTCYKGYGDDENGFYTVYRNVFNEIIQEDMKYVENKEEFNRVPEFGNSKSDYDEIVDKFYSYWMNYFTKNNYFRLNKYDITEIKERRYVKLAERENKKIRNEAKKKRNEEVRNLAAFVRKRDKRVQENIKRIESKRLENRLKQKQISKEKRLERNQEILNESNGQAEWTKFNNLSKELEEIEKNLNEEFGEELSDNEEDINSDFIDHLYCVACNKLFKTTKALENHESSKKHKENLEFMIKTMKEEDNFGDSNEDELEMSLSDCQEDLKLSESEEMELEMNKKSKKQKKKNKKNKTMLTTDYDEKKTATSNPKILSKRKQRRQE